MTTLAALELLFTSDVSNAVAGTQQLASALADTERAVTSSSAGIDSANQKTVQSTQQTAAAVEQAEQKLSTAFVAMGAAAVAGLGLMTKSTLDLASNVRTLQRITGDTAEATSSLIFAGQQMGVSVDAMSTSFGIFEKHLVNADSVVQKYGLSLYNADGTQKSFSQVLLETATMFAALPSAAAQSTAAMELFGRSGKTMLPLLTQGAEGLRSLTAEAEQYGVVMSQTQVDAAKAVTAGMRDLSAAWKGFLVTMGTEALPAIRLVTSALTDFVMWLSQVPGPIRVAVLGVMALAGGLGLVAKAVSPIASTMQSAITIFEAWGKRAAAAAAASTAVEGVGTSAAAAGPGLLAFAGAAGVAAAAAVVLAGFVYEVSLAMETQKANAAAATADQRTLGLVMANSVVSTGQFTDAQLEALGVFRDYGQASVVVQSLQKQLDSAVLRGAIDWKTYTDSVNSAGLALNVTQAELVQNAAAFNAFSPKEIAADFAGLAAAVGSSADVLSTQLDAAMSSLASDGGDALRKFVSETQGAINQWSSGVVTAIAKPGTALAELANQAQVTGKEIANAFIRDQRDLAHAAQNLATIMHKASKSMSPEDYVAFGNALTQADLSAGELASTAKLSTSAIGKMGKAAGDAAHDTKTAASSIGGPLVNALSEAITQAAGASHHVTAVGNALADLPKNVKVQVQINGITSAIVGTINAAAGALQNLAGTYTANVNVSGGASGRATGGPVEAGKPYIVGEHRPELFVPSVPGRIEPRVPAAGAASTERRAAASGPRTVVNLHVNGSEDPQKLAATLSRYLAGELSGGD